VKDARALHFLFGSPLIRLSQTESNSPRCVSLMIATSGPAESVRLYLVV
jgi:hypothetical protein